MIVLCKVFILVNIQTRHYFFCNFYSGSCKLCFLCYCNCCECSVFSFCWICLLLVVYSITIEKVDEVDLRVPWDIHVHWITLLWKQLGEIFRMWAVKPSSGELLMIAVAWSVCLLKIKCNTCTGLCLREVGRPSATPIHKWKKKKSTSLLSLYS